MSNARLFLLGCSALMLPVTALHAQSINVYNWSDYIAEDTIEKFTAATGIAVNYDVYDGNEALEARLLAGSSGFDVVVPTSDFMQRQIAAGVYQPLNKDLLPNIANMDPGLMAAAAAYDEGNTHSVIYMWGSTGIGFNVDMVTERLGPDFDRSWSMIFDPEIAAKLADCGISLLDAQVELIPAALRYLGLDTTSTAEADLTAAGDLLMTMRPNIRYFHSSQYISDLANGQICVSVGYSGDIFQARDRAAEADRGVTVDYFIPSEGGNQWFDMMLIPADAPNPEGAHAFINFIMDAQITADITNYVWYANANTASMPMVDPEIVGDPAIFPPAEVLANMWQLKPYDARTSRTMTRLWTRVKTGQ
jgi:putrescine transport system substrate-binding protein